MKVTHLKIKNIGLIANETVTLNKPLIILYGEVRQGKTTFLNCVRWVLGGSFPADIIKHGAKEGSIEMTGDFGSISRSFYRNKAGETVARQVDFIKDGALIQKPSREIEKFLNPFLINQDHLRGMNEVDRKQYFATLFEVDTKALDLEAANCAKEASELRATVKGYGDIDLTEVKKPDTKALSEERQKLILAHMEHVAKLKEQRDKIQADHLAAKAVIDSDNSKAASNNADRTIQENNLRHDTDRITQLETELAGVKSRAEARREWLNEHPLLVLKPLPDSPDISALQTKILSTADTSAVDAKLSQAAADRVRYDNYQGNLERDKKRQADNKRVLELEARQRAIKEEKATKLKGISENSGVPGLTFDEEGNFLYEGTQAGMLSTSQIMRLSSALSALYPEGFGIELLDGGESLGRAIFDYVEHAKKNNSTVLATVVGQKPALVPENIGVFVVKDGVVLDVEEISPTTP